MATCTFAAWKAAWCAKKPHVCVWWRCSARRAKTGHSRKKLFRWGWVGRDGWVVQGRSCREDPSVTRQAGRIIPPVAWHAGSVRACVTWEAGGVRHCVTWQAGRARPSVSWQAWGVTLKDGRVKPKAPWQARGLKPCYMASRKAKALYYMTSRKKKVLCDMANRMDKSLSKIPTETYKGHETETGESIRSTCFGIYNLLDLS